MSQESERAKKLASDHWYGYVLPTLQAHAAGQQLAYTAAEVMAIAEHHYLTAAAHYYGHAIEDERNGIFRPRIEEPLPAEDVAAISEGVVRFDLSLPPIVLECTASDAALKYEEEVNEWTNAEMDSIEELVELWDTLQAAYTWRDCEGGESAKEAVEEATERIHRDMDNELPVMAAKSAMLFKNATRKSPIGTGYYSPETCAIIIESGGTRWQ